MEKKISTRFKSLLDAKRVRKKGNIKMSACRSRNRSDVYHPEGNVKYKTYTTFIALASVAWLSL